MRLYIGIDLGSTNVKAGAYDGHFRCVASVSEAVSYDRKNGVEIELSGFWELFTSLMRRLTQTKAVKEGQIAGIGFTGQAETLVVLDKEGKPLMNAISWMDERSKNECGELEALLPPDECKRVTGQKAVLATWPATKILWLKRNHKELFENAAYYMLLKDYLVYRLTGRMLADCSIATFSFYFDIYNKCYWDKMLDILEITKDQLPPLAEPCTKVGTLTEEASELTGLPQDAVVNLGTLDHFAGMIGMGNTEPGIISLSTGTVMALAALASGAEAGRRSGIAMHYGFIPDTYVMLPVAESGGISLEWFKNTCMTQMDYDTLNRELERKEGLGEVVFLPYLVGTNAPEFDTNTKGIFYGLRSEHDAVDMAKAVMEGVAFVLRKNCDAIREAGLPIRFIYATGGAARSKVWCQLQADITGLPIVVLQEKEAACLGAAIAAAVAMGDCESYQKAAEMARIEGGRYEPKKSERLEVNYRKFCALYQFMTEMEDGLAAADY
ncbi:MAG: hypothetical protein HFI20_06660 [Lachnospiraceae bacterium]|nr:hypothetical protein [Lachnospiraceae bacterium]